MRKKNSDLHGNAPDRSAMVLLILDLISDFEFEDGREVCKAALPIAKRVAQLKRRAKRAGVPIIYVNDNIGRWRSDFAGMVRYCTREGSRGATVTRLLVPDKSDYCILKPKHSGFFATALDTLLSYIGARKLVLTGISSHQCVLFTANDAYVRDLELHIPRDCMCAASKSDTRFALQYFSTVLHADVRPAPELRFRKGRS